MVAVFPYSKSTENEISFTKGDIIYVLKNSKDDEWNLGTCNGVTGSFPRNYVKVVEGNCLIIILYIAAYVTIALFCADVNNSEEWSH